MIENLLRNGGFELDWGVDKSHRCLILPVDGEPYETDVGNIFTPSGGWVTWFRHDAGTWDQPEVRDAWASGDPRRVHSGYKATLLFTFYRKHDAGFFQRVEVEPGAELRLTAWAHAWSNSKGEGFPHPSDPRWSEGAGYEEVAWTPEEIPPLSGEPQNDAKGNFRFGVGIDPTGGTDPFAATVIWGEPKHIYNGYAQLSVEAVADSGTVTVFLRSRTLYGFRHNDAYWDDAVLGTTDDEPPPYESTMLVLPQDATPEQLSEILGLAYPDRRTFGFSHDDAGNLNGTVVLYNIPASEKNAYLGFYVTRYPNVTVEFAYTSDWVDPPSGLLLKQCDPRWKDTIFGEQ